jgi:spore coat protein CotH
MRTRLLVSMLATLIVPSLLLAADKKPAKDSSARVFGLDKVWSMHLTLAPEQWEKMQPKRGRGFGPPGAPPPREAKPADGAGKKVRGMFGFEYEYVKGDLEIDGKTFKDVGVRYKGNASYASSQGRLKRPFKIDLARYNPSQTFEGQKKLTLNNNVMDASAAREVLSYKVYRTLDVPASRTAYVQLTLTVPGKYDKEFVGLYTLVESIDKTFLKSRFGSAKGLLLKPERVGPLEYLGDDWAAYESRYQPKTPGDAKSKRRLIEFTKLVQKADDKTFKAEIDKYLDVDEFLRFLAGTVALSSMDSFIGLTHNYFIYLDPKTNKFAFLPWDFDHSFGGFMMMGSADDLMDLSIRQPNTNRNRLIERLLADEKVFAVYKGHLRALLDKGFTEEVVQKDLAAINAAVDPIKKKEKEAVAARGEDRGRGGPGFGGPFNRAPDLAKFVAKREESIKGQLDGERKGKVLSGRFGPGGRGFGPGQFLVKPILEATDKNKDGKLSKEEASAAVKALFAAVDKDKKGTVDQTILADGLNKLMPRPGGPGGPVGPGRPGAAPPGRPGAPSPGGPGAAPAAPPGGRPAGPGGPGGQPPFGPPFAGPGAWWAKPIVDKAGKDGKITEKGLLAAAEKLFAEADKNKDGQLDEKELTEELNKFLAMPFGPPGGPPGGRPGAPTPGERERKREER